MSQPRPAWSYLRCSSGRQALDGKDSFRRQIGAGEEFARRHNLELSPEPLIDPGVSAYRGKNRKQGALSQFLDAADRGEIPPGSVLVVESTSRFSREGHLEALKTLMRDFWDRDLALGIVRFDSILDKQAVEREAWRLQMLIGALDADHAYSKELSIRANSAWDGIRSDLRSGKPRLKAKGKAWVDWSETEQRFVLNERSKIIRRMFDLSLQSWGCTSIAKAFNEEGVHSEFGLKGQWSYRCVYKFLNDPAVTGRLTLKGDEPIEGYYPELVTAREFEQVRRGMEERNQRKSQRRGRCNNILAGATKCQCGRPMSYLSRMVKGHRYEYLACTAKRDGACSVKQPFWQYDEVFLLDAVMQGREHWLQWFTDGESTEEFDALRSANKAAQDRLHASQMKLERAESRYQDAYAAGGLSPVESRLQAAAIERLGEQVKADRHAASEASAKLAVRTDLAPASERADEFVGKVLDFRQRLLEKRVGPEERSDFNAWLNRQGVELVFEHGDQDNPLSEAEVEALRGIPQRWLLLKWGDGATRLLPGNQAMLEALG